MAILLQVTSNVRANFYPKKNNNTFDQTKSYQNAALCNVEYKRLFDWRMNDDAGFMCTTQ